MPEPIAHAAAAWVLRCDRGLTAAEQDEFSQWLASDTRHGVQLARHRRHWNRLETLAQWRSEHSARLNPDLLAPPRRRMQRFLPIALAASPAVAVVFFVSKPNQTKPARVQHGTAATASTSAAVTQRTLRTGPSSN